MARFVPPVTDRKDMDLIYAVCGKLLEAPASFPLTYTYGGRTERGLPRDAGKTWRLLDANMAETVYTAQVPDSPLEIRVECLSYRDFPVAEWTAYFTNTGAENSAILEDVRAADMAFCGRGAALRCCNGDFYSETGYTQKVIPLGPGDAFTQAPSEGRACNEAWPYQRLMFDGWGVNIAIGWPAQWESACEGTEDGVRYRAGQQTVHTYLKPGETLRTPRMCLMAFHGDETRGMNLWRRFMNAHVTPRTRGNLLPPRATASEPGDGEEFTAATESLQFEAMDRLKTFGWSKDILWWIDAGWYPCYVEPGVKRWPHTGTWEPDRAKFPRGMGPIGDKAHEMGIDFLIWYEPERVRPGTELAQRHPEWLLSARISDEMRSTGTDVNQFNDDNYMLDLSNDECCDWLCERVDALIKDSHQDVYRQDFNFSPLPYWRCNEAEDRKGMLENKYQQNYLKFWDYLLSHNPNLWIDSCASGGRRNDLETMRRAVPLHPTDYGYGYHPVSQDFRRALHAWIPYTRGQSTNWLSADGERYQPLDELDRLPARPLTNYDLVNGMGALFPLFGVSSAAAFPGQPEYIGKMLKVWEEFAPILLRGDFYPLTEPHRSAEKWTVFQFDLPEEGRGAFQVLRNSQAAEDSVTVRPAGFDPDREYALRDGETGETRALTGREICEKGVEFAQPRPSGSVWFYEVKYGLKAM